ncbi:MAG: GNAT family N-acetyltransferase [Chloroflexi bacterium]|jgi:ribosomal protein S18 acetylase RimI-like enzyme|nr:GNAT family N-acetyltransferase [Chloroflexota bacterium]
MIAQAAGVAAASEHIRPFLPYRDLADLATLIEAAFGPELAATGSHLVQDLRQMAMLGPLLRGPNRLMSPFYGFVWTESGELVGNVSLSPEREDRAVWSVTNVAVMPEHRGRGIASQLMDRAIAFARARGVRRLILQVRPDNDIAVALYRRCEFATLDTVHELRLHKHQWPLVVGGPAARGDAAGTLRAPRAADHAEIRALLARLATVGGQPVSGRQSTRHPWVWSAYRLLHYAVTAEQTFEVVACPAGRPVAYAFAQTNSLRGPHEAALYVAPQHRGRYEAALWEWLLARLRRAVPQHVQTTLSVSHPEALTAAWDLGFRTVRVLDQMALDLQPGRDPACKGMAYLRTAG